MAPAAKPYTFGKDFSLDELKPAKAERKPNPRDEALTVAIRHAASLDATRVLPVHLDPKDKPATVTAAARRIVKALGLSVNVGTTKALPGTLLLSTGVLSTKGQRAKAA